VELTPGARVDRYVLVEPLGEGGQGTVWKAEDLLHPGLPRALKLVPLALSRPSDVERVRREAHALARLEHPSLVASHALFEDLKLAVLGIAMDFVDGTTLRKHTNDARLTERHRIAVLRHVAQALAYVHRNGVVHRDLKLDNLLVTTAFWATPDDPQNVKLVDFGIAKVEGGSQPLTQLDTVVGTLAYLAPEQLDPAHFSDNLPKAADIFAFGILGWYLLVGEHPTALPPNATIVDFASAYRQAANSSLPWPPGIPIGRWGELLRDCLALRTSARLRTGEELARRLDELTGADTIVRPAAGSAASLETSPTSVASPRAMLGATVDIAPMRGADGRVEPTRTSLPSIPAGGARDVPNQSDGFALQAKSPAILRWLAPACALVALGAAGVAAYYALRANRAPEMLPPPLPTSVGSSQTLGSDLELASEGLDGNAGDAARLRPADCDSQAALCTCCPSGHDCAGDCDDIVSLAEHWQLRVGSVAMTASDGAPLTPDTEVCLRVASRKDIEKCTRLVALADGGIVADALDVDGMDLVQNGIEVAVYQKSTTPVPLARGTLKRSVNRLELCKGIELTLLEEPGPVERIVLYLDPANAVAPARCEVAPPLPR